ncbi:MAG: choice-of-anchor D domain-containing protein [Akkermansiaceae bacterium]|nr:choice-of-anchor D domain-containing protein [Akkermansiaceae bacterium]MCP5545893.1 choice-of-anchor D domain-containing protein [Akkermansiaceae bacterium]
MLSLMAPDRCRAGLYGFDSLAEDLGNWNRASLEGGGTMRFQKSRLEYLVVDPAPANGSVASWLPNSAAIGEAWFAEVDVHLDVPTLPDNSLVDLGIQVEPWPGGGGLCYHSMNKVRAEGQYEAGFTIWSEQGLLESFGSEIKTATLRIHHDPGNRTLTGSVSDGSLWVYTSPISVLGWGMGSADRFNVVLVGRNHGEPFPVRTGQVYFKNFRAGAARPEITVEQPVARYISDGKSSTSFGKLRTGGSRTKTYLIRNQGTKPLQGLRIRIDGANKKDFRVSGSLKSDVLMPGASMKAGIRFHPRKKGRRRAELHILSNDPDERSFDVGLKGKGK